MRDGGRETGPELLVGRQLRQRREEEHKGPRVGAEGLLADPPAGCDVAQDHGGRRTGSHEAPLAVEDDDRVGEPRKELPNPFRLSIHHPFTTPSPFGDPSDDARYR
jgi:hypothetical protein